MKSLMRLHSEIEVIINGEEEKGKKCTQGNSADQFPFAILFKDSVLLWVYPVINKTVIRRGKKR